MNQIPYDFYQAQNFLLTSNESSGSRSFTEKVTESTSSKQPNMFLVSLHQILDVIYLLNATHNP